MKFILIQLKLEEIKTRLKRGKALFYSRTRKSAKGLSERSRAKILLIAGSNYIR
jgi:hypothetical protein